MKMGLPTQNYIIKITPTGMSGAHLPGGSRACQVDNINHHGLLHIERKI